MCHGREGDAIPSVDLSSGEFLSRRTDESLIKSIGEGVPGMPAYSQDQNGPLTREEIKAIVEWLRSQGE
jgi:mono/diheme cytochrome c family protein